MRVTQRLMVNRVLSDLNNQTERLLGLQEELSTGLKVNTPSDDPLAARRGEHSRQHRRKRAIHDQYLDRRAAIDGIQQRNTDRCRRGPARAGIDGPGRQRHK